MTDPAVTYYTISLVVKKGWGHRIRLTIALIIIRLVVLLFGFTTRTKQLPTKI